MFTYKACTEVTSSQMFEAFSQGFSDYFFPLIMSEEEFTKHFFGPEGNALEYSFLAFEGERPIGIILGGTRMFDGIKTMRCGTLGLGPEYRGKGISHRLFELHKEIANKVGCKQLLLEVIRENHRAIAFYKKLGYLESTILKYYTKQIEMLPALVESPPYQVDLVSYDMIKSLRDDLLTCHINWQNDTPYYENDSNDIFLGAFDEYKTIGLIAVTPRGKINFLWVDPKYRMQKVGHYLLLEVANHIITEKLAVCISSNPLLEGFFRKLDFHKEVIEQYEMYLPL